MGELINLNPPAPIADGDLPPSIARDSEVSQTMAAHLSAADPHLQYLTQARGDARYVRRYGQYFRAAPSVSQLLTQNVVTKINFDTITSNIGNQYSSANNRLIALETTELWRITAAIEFNLPASSRFYLWLAKNGGASLIQLLDVTTVGFFNVTTTPADITLLQGEYLELWTRILNIPNGSIFGSTSLNTCWWEGSRVG